MKVAVALFALFAAASAGVIAPAAVIPATTLVRTPSLDSAIIKSDRLGGNFAYSTVEGHAYAAVSPVVQNVVSPVGVSYSATPIATPITVQQQYIHHPQVFAIPQQQVIAPVISGIPQQQVIAPVIPGVAAPAFPIFPTDNLVPIAPAAEKPAEVETAVVAEAAPEPAPLPQPAEAPQADPTVSVEAV